VVTAFKKVDGVSDAKASCTDMTATIIYDPAKATEETLVKALEGTKYKNAGKAEPKKESNPAPVLR